MQFNYLNLLEFLFRLNIMFHLVTRVSRLALVPRTPPRVCSNIFSQRAEFSTTGLAGFRLTEVTHGGMTKKKKKQDPNQLRARDDKRKRRLAKALRKMEKKDRQIKPLIECEVPLHLHKEAVMRKREVEVSTEMEEERIQQAKDWSRFALARHSNEIWHQDKIMISQQKALEELKKESVPLYMSAIQFDVDLMPLTLKGPVATPPIQGYIQDGEYKETTPTYKVIYEDTDAYMKSLLMRRRDRSKKHAEQEE